MSATPEPIAAQVPEAAPRLAASPQLAMRFSGYLPTTYLQPFQQYVGGRLT
jgi:hypothetical protein